VLSAVLPPILPPFFFLSSANLPVTANFSTCFLPRAPPSSYSLSKLSWASLKRCLTITFFFPGFRFILWLSFILNRIPAHWWRSFFCRSLSQEKLFFSSLLRLTLLPLTSTRKLRRPSGIFDGVKAVGFPPLPFLLGLFLLC